MAKGWMEETNREVMRWAEDLPYAEEDRATGAAFRRLVESGSRFNVERVWADQPWEVWVYDRREHPSYGKTFEEAVNAALGAEPGADA